MRSVLLALLLSLTPVMLLASQSGVTVADDLGKVSSPVGNRSEAARGEALRVGLEEVLVRMTGKRAIADTDIARQLLGQPQRWLEQYGYADKDGGLVLEARFNVSGLSAQLARAGEALWGETRPVVLVWLVDERGEIVARDSEHPLLEAAREQARYRGLPLLWPAMDGDDRASITAADIRGRFDRHLREASARYPAALMVTGVIYGGAAPSLRWRLLQDQQSLDEGQLERPDNRDQGALSKQLVDQIADHVAGIYAVVIGDGTGLALRVEQLDSLRAYDSVRRHLSGLAGMQSVHLRGLNGERADFELEFSGPPLQLERLLHLHASLSSCEDMPVDEDVSGLLRVCWRADD